MSARGGNVRTWKTSNTLHKRMKSTLRGDPAATLKSLREGFSSSIPPGANMYDHVAIPNVIMKGSIDNLIANGYTEAAAKMQGPLDALNEWLAINTSDFTMEIQLVYSLVEEHHAEEYSGKLQGFPPGFNYRFPGKDIINGHDYIACVMQWVDDLFMNSEVFPETDLDQFPMDFISNHMKKVYTRLTRVYAIMFSRCVESLEKIGATPQLTTSWKHFYYFVRRFELVDQKEFEPFKLPAVKHTLNMKDMEIKYKADMKAGKTKTSK